MDVRKIGALAQALLYVPEFMSLILLAVSLFYFFAQDSPACAGHDEPQSAHRACFRDRAVKAIPAASNAGDTEDAL